MDVLSKCVGFENIIIMVVDDIFGIGCFLFFDLVSVDFLWIICVDYFDLVYFVLVVEV